jgi:hypothetical protein
MLDAIRNDLPTVIEENQISALEHLTEAISDPDTFCEQFSLILESDPFVGSTMHAYRNADGFTWRIGSLESDKWITQKFYVVLLSTATTEAALERIQQFWDEGKGKNCRCVVLYETSGALELFHGSYDLAMNVTFFAMLLAYTITFSTKGASALLRFMEDACGNYDEDSFLNFSLRNYISKERAADSVPAYRLLYNQYAVGSPEESFPIKQLIAELDEHETLSNYEILPWGRDLQEYTGDLAACPTIILIDQSHITHSESLTKFMTLMREQRYENCYVLFNSETQQSRWNAPPATGGLAWDHNHSQIPKMCVTSTSEAISYIQSSLLAWHHKSFLIGISYAHYDPHSTHTEGEECWESDDQKITRLAERLKERYGEHRILFDQFPTSRPLFIWDRGQERSLDAYRACKVHLILWNFWTDHNVNCRAEREQAIFPCLDGGTADCIFLTTSPRYSAALPRVGTFSRSLNDNDNFDELLNQIGQRLTELQN